MKVTIKSLSADMEIKNKGIELDVYSPDGETHHGDLVVNKAGLVWCKGRVRAENGIKVSWGDFMNWVDQRNG